MHSHRRIAFAIVAAATVVAGCTHAPAATRPAGATADTTFVGPIGPIGDWAPRFPSMLLAAGVEGVVVAEIRVDSIARVDAGFLRPVESTHELFVAEVRRALPHWEFLAARQSIETSTGVWTYPVTATRRVTVLFRAVRDSAELGECRAMGSGYTGAATTVCAIAPPDVPHGSPVTPRARRPDCVLYAADLVRPPTPTARHMAIAMMSPATCPAEAPAALAVAWRTTDTTDVALTTATKQLADRRLLELVTDVALDDARPRSVRLEALAVLVSYARPGLLVWFREERPSHVRIAHLDRVLVTERAGTVPLDSADRAGVVDRLDRVARTSRDMDLRVAAGSLAQQLRMWTGLE